MGNGTNEWQPCWAGGEHTEGFSEDGAHENVSDEDDESCKRELTKQEDCV